MTIQAKTNQNTNKTNTEPNGGRRKKRRSNHEERCRRRQTLVQIFAKCTVYEISPHEIFFSTPRSILLQLIGDNYEMGTANTNEFQMVFIANHSPQTIGNFTFIPLFQTMKHWDSHLRTLFVGNYFRFSLCAKPSLKIKRNSWISFKL